MLNSDTRCRPLLAMLFSGPSKGWGGGPWGGGLWFLVRVCQGVCRGVEAGVGSAYGAGGGGEVFYVSFGLCLACLGCFCLYVKSAKVHWLAHLKATLYNLEGFPLLPLLRTKKRGLV